MIKRVVAVLVAAFLLLSFIPQPIFVAGASNSDELEAAKQKKNELQAELEAVQARLESINNEADRLRELQNSYAFQMENIKAQITAIDTIVEVLMIQLAEAQSQLDQKVRELGKSYRDFGQRLRAMYMSSDSTVLSVLLGADSFLEFVVAAEYMRRMNEHDAAAIDRIITLRDEITAARDKINQDMAEQETARLEKEQLLQDAALLMQQVEVELTEAEAYAEFTAEEEARLLREYEAQQEEINQLMRVESEIPYVGGNFRWPLPGFDLITSVFGWRELWGADNFHSGTDIAGSGVYGAGIIASNDGVVTNVVYGSYGYGYYVIIDHGGGYMTLYAHMSEIYVVEGETVSQGSVIGAVGSTGMSTGPHLHFEIRINGEAVDAEQLLLSY